MNLDFDSDKKQNPFTVPDGFFQQNRDTIMGRVARHRRIMFIRRSAAAAAVVTVAMMAWTQWNHTESLSPEQSIDLLISQSSDAQLNDAVILADAEYLFNTDIVLTDY